MKKFLCVGEEYESNGEKKMRWNRIGETFEGKNKKQYVKLYHMPGVFIHVFEDQPQQQKQTTKRPHDSEDIDF